MTKIVVKVPEERAEETYSLIRDILRYGTEDYGVWINDEKESN